MIPWHAILRFHEALLLCLGAALLYGWLLRRLAEVMHWRRMRLAEIGEKYLTLDLSWTERRQVEFYLNNAFNPWAMIVVSGLLPPLLIYQIVKRPDDNVEQPANVATEDEICWLFTLSTFAANPFFGLIVIFETALFAVLLILLGGRAELVRRAIDKLVAREADREFRRSVPVRVNHAHSNHL